ncbi:MAG: twin-arginine translocase subunit TatB [Rhodobiaceae bacterium]|jgi:sec-independent protein translocase protein TatB|nr:twin-arginine translocase subunit TatB [Rhodobiaceae bacterium]RPF97399.1 MAG: twin-arginine translocase subunit TatB [Rhizobiales bacterium TMED227]|tara:strand:- start:27219 stop:27482 length:264 start_codon:yes stop_codon:yes gene_type:complete
MFNIGWQELLIISVVIVLILGPKELPTALNTFLKFSRKIKRISRDFLEETESILSKEDLDKVKETMRDINYNNDLTKEIDEIKNIKE